MKLRAAIAGAGLMGYWHAKNLVRCGGEVAAVIDRDPAAASRLAGQFSGALPVSSLEEALATGKIEVLHLCTPLESHGELAAAALVAGIHVLAEKPLVPTLAETESLYALAAKHRVTLCPVHQFPFQRGVRQAAQNLPRIGQLRHFEARFCSAGGSGKNSETLAAIIADILPHPLSLMALFAPGSLQTTGWSVSRSAPGELRATLTAADICFSILVSMNSRPTNTSLLLLGSAGTIHIDLFHGFSVVEPGAVSRWRKIVHPFDLSTRTLFAAGANLVRRASSGESAYPGLRGLIAAFYSSITQKTEPPIHQAEVSAIAQIRDFITRPL